MRFRRYPPIVRETSQPGHAARPSIGSPLRARFVIGLKKIAVFLFTSIVLTGGLTAQPRLGDVSSVSLEEMIGQMLVVGFDGTRPRQRWPQRLRDQLQKGRIGGVIFLARNLSSARNAKALAHFFANAASRHPPFIAIDQEGGWVQRLSGNVGLKRKFSASRVAVKFTPEQAVGYYRAVARDLRDFGFNVNFGPVVDLNTNPKNPIIGRRGRSYSRDPDIVAQYGAAFVRGHRAEGIITALKHFPGHGSSRRDSHIGFVDISNTWSEQELVPFARLIETGLADMVMVGHLHLDYYQDVETGAQPATFSRKLVGDVLRHQLKFDGVIISDDLEMGAIRNHYKPGEALVRAIKAGNNMLIFSSTAKNDMSLPERYVAIIKEAALKDPKLKAQITKSYLRIIALKLRYLRRN